MVQTSLDFNSILTTLVTSMVGGGAASAAFWALAREKMREIFVTKEAYARDEVVREQMIVQPLKEVVNEMKALNIAHSESAASLKTITELFRDRQ